MANILLVGCGDIGTRLGITLADSGHHCYGLKRDPSQLPPSIQGIKADITQPDTLAELPHVDYVIYSLVPSQYNEQGYRQAYLQGLQNLLAALEQQSQQPARVFFISTTAVYHQQDSEWVDERSDTEPARFNGQVMLEAERYLQQSAIVGSAIRFSGIYGPGRERTLSWVKQGIGALAEPTYYGNRIHIEDCVAVLKFLIARDQSGLPMADCYLASDPHPTSYHELLGWLRQQLSITAPESLEDFSQKLHTGSKRCRPRRLLDAGYQFIYTDYQAGFKAIIAHTLQGK